MKVFQALGEDKGGFTQLPEPTLREDQVLVRVVYCGICGTDYALHSGNSGFVREGRVTYPVRLGHEWSGVVAKVGSAVTEFKPGDRVIGDNAVACEKCDACLSGNYTRCTNLYSVGTIDPIWPGAFAEYIVMPARQVYHVADNVSLLDAALVEPLSVAWGGIKKMDITPDSVVAVIGTGCIAMAAVALAKAKGAGQVYLVGRNPYKLGKGLECGATEVVNIRECNAVERLQELTGGRLADYVLECSGASSSVELSFRLTQKRGMVAMLAFYEQLLEQLDMNVMVMNELTIVGIMGEIGNSGEVLQVMAEHDLGINKCITEHIDFDGLPEAMCQPDTSKLIKTMVKVSEE